MPMASICCPKYNCKGIFNSPFTKAGKKIKCPYCRNWFTVREKDIIEKDD
jgi:hypothetical protein